MRALVTGATGYIGGRLVPALLDAGLDVRATARHPERLRDFEWHPRVQTVGADVLDRDSLQRAVEGCDVAYYLVHAMASGPGFAERDRRAAELFAEAAGRAGVRRVVYLGGIVDEEDERLSAHLRSRAEVGRILLAGDAPAVALQAGVILGSGSASFEMLRYLTERLPAMITPRWVHTRVQPIAVHDVLHYLVGAASLPPDVRRGFDIGGPDVLTYKELMQRYAAVAKLPRRVIIPVPVLTPRSSAHWVGLVTPVPSALAKPLVESLRNEVVCREHDIDAHIPPPPEGLLGFDAAVARALSKVREAQVVTRWSSASTPGAPSDPLPTDPAWTGGSLFVDERETAVDAPADDLWRVVEGIGGENGWYSFPLAWAVRGQLDRFVGGVGLRRGRRDPQRLRVGDSLDWWRVEEVERGRLLRLRAEMKVPGLAWLELRVEREGARSRYRQRAVFAPHGLLGHLYWWSVAPFHGFVFGGMVRNVARAAERFAAATPAQRADAA